jgi:hypothetical protein
MRPRQYLFALVDGGGNVPPELHAVRKLIEGGHAVTVLADDSVAPEVTSTGAQFGRWLRAPNRTIAGRSTIPYETGSASIPGSSSTAWWTRCSSVRPRHMPPM